MRSLIEIRADTLNTPELPPSRDIPYEVKKFAAFCLDPIIEKYPPLRETQFRINLATLDHLRTLVGDEAIDPLEATIVENRWRSMRGLATRMVGQGAMTGTLSAGLADPNIFTALFGITGFGDVVETLDHEAAYAEVKKSALPVIQKLFLEYTPDLYDLSESEKQNFVNEVTEAIGLGESLSRPHLTTGVYTAINAPILFLLNQQWASGVLVAAEVALQKHLQNTLLSGVKTHEELDEQGRDVSDAMTKDEIFHTDIGAALQLTSSLATANTSQRRRSVAERIGVQFLTRYTLPIIALYTQGIGLALSQAGQLVSHLDPVYLNKKDFADAQAGLNTLINTLSYIEGQNLSLLSDHRIRSHCKQVSERQLESVSIPSGANTVAVIAPYRLKFEGKPKKGHRMKKPLILPIGISKMSGRSGQGESLFLKAITHKIKTDEDQESLVNISVTGEPQWQRLHELPPDSIHTISVYLDPETKDSKLSPFVLFPKAIVPTPLADYPSDASKQNDIPAPIQFNEYINDFITRYVHGDALNKSEEVAIAYTLQYFSGIKTREEIEQEVKRIPKSKGIEISVTLELFRYFGRYFSLDEARKGLMNKCRQYAVTINGRELPLFNNNDFQALNQVSFADPIVNRELRAKLRVIAALEHAAEAGTKILAIDNTLDPLSNEDTDLFIAYIDRWSKNHKVAVLIATREDYNDKAIIGSSAYKQSIFFHGGFVNVGTEKIDAGGSISES